MILDDLRKRIKKNNFFYWTYSSIVDHNYRAGFTGYIVRKNFKSRDRVRDELATIKEYWKCDPSFYYRYRLYEKDLSTEELLDYIPPFYFYNFYMPSLYGQKQVDLTGSKIKMNEYFNSRNICTPEVKCIIRNGAISGMKGEKMDFFILRESLIKSDTRSFFVKPDGGRGGKGIMKITKEGTELMINNELLHRKLFEKLTANNTYVIQEGLVQRSDFRSIYPYSVNTLRVITQHFHGESRIIAVVLRMGRNGSFVDNSSIGGVFAPVDINTGRISDRASLLHDPTKFEVHPDTGFRFRGFTISNWDEIKDRVLQFVASIPEFPDVAWDIALLENKIMAIEININYGLDQLQCCMGGMRRRLNIEPLIYYKKQ